MYDQIPELLQTLHRMNPVKADDRKTNFEGFIYRLTSRLRRISIILFLALCAAAAWTIFGPAPTRWSISVIQLIGIAGMSTALASLILDIIPGILLILRFQGESLRNFNIEIQHDLAHAAEIMEYKTELLEAVRKLLSIKIDRIGRRLGIFWGGADKIALISLAMLGWSAWEEFSNFKSMWQKDFFMYATAFIGGLAFGAVLLNALAQRYAYQRDLLEIAIELQRKNEMLPKFYFVPSPKFSSRVAQVWNRLRSVIRNFSTVL